MAGRIRTVKPEWIEDEKLLLASPAARVLSVALILMADDYGNGRANEQIIVSRIFPGHSREGLEGFRELRETGFFCLYSVRGQTYYTIPRWSEHQRVDKPGKPRVPGPSEADENFREAPGKIPEILATDHDHDHDHDHSLAHPPPEPAPERERFDFDTVYAEYPRKVGKARGKRIFSSKIRSRASYDRCLTAAKEMGELWAGMSRDRLKFCPQFDTWLSKDRWKDEEQIGPSDGEQGQRPQPPKLELL